MARDDEDARKDARALYLEVMGGEEGLRRFREEAERRYQQIPKDLSPEQVFDYALAQQTASMALTLVQGDMGEDGTEDRFKVFQNYIRAMPTDAQYEYGAGLLDMTPERFRERVEFLNERVVTRFREIVARTEAPEYVEEETHYLLGLVDRGGKPEN